MNELALYQHFSDTELLKQYLLSKNGNWLNVLFKRYSLLVYGVCLKYLKNDTHAQDASQQIFEKCFIEIQKYEVAYFKSWLYQITKNYCLMQLRQSKEFSSDDMGKFATNSYNQEEVAEQKNDLLKKELTLNKLAIALEALQPEQRDCVKLFYLEKKTYQEIAAQLNINYLQVKSAIQNGKRNLKIMLEKNMTQK